MKTPLSTYLRLFSPYAIRHDEKERATQAADLLDKLVGELTRIATPMPDKAGNHAATERFEIAEAVLREAKAELYPQPKGEAA